MLCANLDISEAQIEAFCRRWKIEEMALFGSVLGDEFGPESDIDVLVTFADDADWSLLDVVGAQMELSELAGRPVDLLERPAIERSRNPFRRKSILESARVVYAR